MGRSRISRWSKAEKIPITARIMSWSSLLRFAFAKSSVRNGMNRDAAIQQLQKGAHSHFDPTIVDLFVRHLPESKLRSSVRGLADQNIAAHPTPTRCGRRKTKWLAHGRTPHSRLTNQIRNRASRRDYACTRFARKIWFVLQVENTLSVLVDKVGHDRAFRHLRRLLYDEVKVTPPRP